MPIVTFVVYALPTSDVRRRWTCFRNIRLFEARQIEENSIDHRSLLLGGSDSSRSTLQFSCSRAIGIGSRMAGFGVPCRLAQ